MRPLQITLMLLVAILVGMLFGSDCKDLWVSVVFISVLSLLVPVVLLATGTLKKPLVQGVTFYVFIGFSLFGSIILLSGLFGLFADTGFLANACTGTNLATKFAIKTLGFAAKGL